MLDEVDEKLGFPSVDPHGSPIPRRRSQVKFPLSSLQVGEEALLSAEQAGGEYIAARLWEEQLLPGEPLRLTEKNEQFLRLHYQQRTVQLPLRLAQQIKVIKQPAAL